MRLLGTTSQRREALPVAAIVLVTAVAASLFALQLSEFTIMPDELGYVKQAVELSHADVPTPGSFWFNSWALLHSLILAPLYRVFSTTTAFDVGHVIGALLMASTAIPAYLLARRVLAWRPGALFVAALTVAVPWIAMSGTMMTEVVAYPVFAWACLAMLDGVSRPGLRGDLVVAVALGVAFVSRTQLLVLAPAYVLALLIDVLARREGTLRERVGLAVRAHAPMIAVVVVGTLVVLASGSTKRVLGGYSDPTHGSLFPPGTGAATRELVTYVVVAAGAIPLALGAAWALTTLGRRATRDEHAFAALLVTVIPVLAVIGGSFTVRFTLGINDRYFFYILPLLFLGGIAALDRPRRWMLPALAATGALSVWLIGTAKIVQQGPSLVSPSMAWHTWLTERADDVGVTMPHLVAIATAIVLVAIAIAQRFVPPPALIAAVGGLLLAWGVVQTGYTFDKVAATQEGVSKQFLAERGWIDRALPKNSRAIVVLASLGDPAATTATWWDTSFWNKAVDQVVVFGNGQPYSQGFQHSFNVDPETGRVPELDRYQYVVRYANDTRFGLRGSETVAGAGGILVLTAQRPYVAEWVFTGPDPDAANLTPGTSGKLRAFAPGSASKLAITLAASGSKPVPVRVASGTPAGTGLREQITQTAQIPGGGRTTVTVPAAFEGGRADVTLELPMGAAGDVALIGVSAS